MSVLSLFQMGRLEECFAHVAQECLYYVFFLIDYFYVVFVNVP